MQHSLAQRVAIENAFTPLSFTRSDTRYADLRGNINRFSAQLSYNSGTQYAEFSPGNKYDFSTFNGNIEYNFERRRFSIKPGLSYQYALYDDRKYSDIVHKTGIFNSRGTITTASASLRSEYKLFNNRLRLVGGVALSKFNYPDTVYGSYQLAATWKFNKKNLVRAVFSGAPRSSYIFDTYVDQTFQTIPAGTNKHIEWAIRGNKNLRLLTANMIEAGFRSEITRNISVDAEVFNIRSKNYNFQVIHKPYTMIAGADTINMVPLMTTNLPMRLEQTGVTISITVNTRRFKIKPFATWQQTRLKDYVTSGYMPDAGFSAVNIYSGMGNRSVLNSTPALFGGGTVDYKLFRKMNLNINGYYYTKQEYYQTANIIFNDGVHGIDHIAGKFILNANISYEPVKGLQLFCAGKNLLNQTAREFFHTDKVPFMLIGGVSYQL
jgi:iron complex outermembrane receptor protein